MLFDRFLALLAPHTCLGCAAEGRLLCPACRQLLPPPPTSNLPTALLQVTAVTSYTGLAKELVRQLKFHSARSAAQEMAELLAPLCPITAPALIVPVPTASSRVRARSYDQAELLAKALARQLQLPYCPLLRRLGQAHQVGADRHTRLAQLTRAYRLQHPARVAGQRIILVDDVSTTGATLEAAAHVLRQAGAKHISAAVFAQA